LQPPGLARPIFPLKTMKLNIAPASTGMTWVRLGIKTFMQQPLAMSGLFFLYMAVNQVAPAHRHSTKLM
jgi:hypothetical protein